jgi:DNA polymerase
MARGLDQSDEAGPLVSSLGGLRDAENACRRCPLYRNATQAVPGEGSRHAAIMLVGEQPGDKEDRAGQPFVGPAGRLLDKALADAGIKRSETFVTNAMKHFKHEPRGKRRLHKRPNAYEIDRCRWWLERELAIVKPDLIVALGATAARSLFRRPLAVGKARGRPLSTPEGIAAFVTIHPSLLLRIKEQTDKEREYNAFVSDLERAGKYLRSHRKAA